MKLPENVGRLLQALEDAGYPTYAVGGCVRDHLLGLAPHDYDLCTAATPAEMRALFAQYRLVLAGEKHGTVGVITDDGVVEITAFRTEGDYGDNRHPGRVEFVRSVEEDLARRDFTVNAMAWSPIRGLCDPFGGAKDLEEKVLRAVGDPYARFREDSLRILRGVRFAVRFGLVPEERTLQAMKDLAFLMDNLSRERVLDELCKLLPLVDASDLLTYQPILTQVLPELASAVGFRQHSPHHAYDVYTHTAHVVAGVPRDLTLRWAALLHDVGKPACFSLDESGRGHFYGHAQVSAQMAEEAMRRLKAPNALREEAVFLIEHHMTTLEADPKLLRRRLSRYGETRLRQLIALQRADYCAKGVIGDPPDLEGTEAALADVLARQACLTVKDLAINGHDLMALGLQGKAVGLMLNRLLELVLDEQLPNEKNALLHAVQNM